MNWDAIGAIAETVGALAVIATLIYLSLQIRSQVRSTKAQILQARSDTLVGLTLKLAESEDLARVQSQVFQLTENGWEVDTEVFKTLPPVDLVRYHAFQQANAHRFQALVAQHKLGFFDEETSKEIFEALESSMGVWTKFGMKYPGLERDLEAYKAGT